MSSLLGLTPVILYVVDRHCENNWSLPMYKQDTFRIIFIISGSGEYKSEDYEAKLSEGMVIINPPLCSMSIKTSFTNPMHIYGFNIIMHSIYFNHKESKTTIKQLDELPIGRISKFENITYYENNLRDLVNEWTGKKIGYDIKCRSILLNLLHELFLLNIENDKNSESYKYIMQAALYIRNNVKEKILIPDLANRCGYSTNYFRSIFKKYMGFTPVSYINCMKIEKALELLNNGYTVKEASLEVGFSDPFYFNKVFKKIKYTSPKLFKNKNTEY